MTSVKSSKVGWISETGRPHKGGNGICMNDLENGGISAIPHDKLARMRSIPLLFTHNGIPLWVGNAPCPKRNVIVFGMKLERIRQGPGRRLGWSGHSRIHDFGVRPLSYNPLGRAPFFTACFHV